MADATSQPGLADNPTINTGNSITTGLVICAQPVTGFLRNIVNGQNAAIFATAPTAQVNLGLNCYKYGGGYLRFTGSGMNAANNVAGRTEFILINVTNNATALQSASSIGQDDFWYCPRGGGGAGTNASCYDTKTTATSPIPAITADLPTNQIISIAYTATNLSVTGYLNGALGLTVAETTVYPADTYYDCGRGEGTEYNQNFIFLHLVWNRQLSASEISLLHGNPWQVFNSGSTDGSASGTAADILLTPATGTATAQQAATGTGVCAAIVLTAANGTADNSTIGDASGACAAIVLSAATATATGGKSVTASGTCAAIQLVAATGQAYIDIPAESKQPSIRVAPGETMGSSSTGGVFSPSARINILGTVVGQAFAAREW